MSSEFFQTPFSLDPRIHFRLRTDCHDFLLHQTNETILSIEEEGGGGGGGGEGNGRGRGRERRRRRRKKKEMGRSKIIHDS